MRSLIIISLCLAAATAVPYISGKRDYKDNQNGNANKNSKQSHQNKDRIDIYVESDSVKEYRNNSSISDEPPGNDIDNRKYKTKLRIKRYRHERNDRVNNLKSIYKPHNLIIDRWDDTYNRWNDANKPNGYKRDASWTNSYKVNRKAKEKSSVVWDGNKTLRQQNDERNIWNRYYKNGNTKANVYIQEKANDYRHNNFKSNKNRWNINSNNRIRYSCNYRSYNDKSYQISNYMIINKDKINKRIKYRNISNRWNYNWYDSDSSDNSNNGNHNDGYGDDMYINDSIDNIYNVRGYNVRRDNKRDYRHQEQGNLYNVHALSLKNKVWHSPELNLRWSRSDHRNNQNVDRWDNNRNSDRDDGERSSKLQHLTRADPATDINMICPDLARCKFHRDANIETDEYDIRSKAIDNKNCLDLARCFTVGWSSKKSNDRFLNIDDKIRDR